MGLKFKCLLDMGEKRETRNRDEKNFEKSRFFRDETWFKNSRISRFSKSRLHFVVCCSSEDTKSKTHYLTNWPAARAITNSRGDTGGNIEINGFWFSVGLLEMTF